ncbi:MAG: hypothetical protein JW862_16960, partial [Anaerolineales bacterium]|nr:hypothetical protein [Anaerolineales bacterium]
PERSRGSVLRLRLHLRSECCHGEVEGWLSSYKNLSFGASFAAFAPSWLPHQSQSIQEERTAIENKSVSNYSGRLVLCAVSSWTALPNHVNPR